MSFDDLPDNWADLPLDTPGLAADVADLVVGHRDRVGGCLGLVLTGDDLTMVQPAVVNDVDDTVQPEELRGFLVRLCHMVAEKGGALLFVRGRDGSVLITDSDRRWHQVAIDACRVAGIPLVGAFLATPGVVRAFPEPLGAVVDGVAS
jgi:hypothetical protein